MQLPISAQAKITKTIHVELTDTKAPTYIGKHSYITTDTKSDLDAQTITLRHQNNLRGKKSNNKAAFIPNNGGSLWLLFSVTNNTPENEWVLDLGTPASGKQGIIRSFSVYQKANTQSTSSQSDPLNIRISTGQTLLLAIRVVSDRLTPSTITPFLKPAKLGASFLERFLPIALGILFTALCVFYLTTSLLRKHISYLAFLPFYILTAGYGILLLNRDLLLLPFGAEITFTILTLIACALLILTKVFLKLSVEQYIYNNLLFITGFCTIAFCILSILLPDRIAYIRNICLFLLPVIPVITISYITLTDSLGGKRYAWPFALGCLIGLLGTTLTAAAQQGWIWVDAFTLNAYWFCFFLQSIFFMWATFQKVQLREDEKRHMQLRESRKARSMVRLQHSKESADQARLLRVIERERELMTELRERETLRTQEMRSAKNQADEANRAKSAFLAVVSHEIRTPMTAILGMVRLLGDTYINKEQSDYVTAIQQSGETMLALLNDILDFEKIERGGLELESINFDLKKLVQNIMMLMTGHASEKSLELKADIAEDVPQFAIGDPTRLRQVLLNLVSNSLKFTHKGHVTIEVSIDKTQTIPSGITPIYALYFAVKDSGIGISEKAQENLFKPFAQADKSTSRRYGGTGLGLTICKKLIEHMGGTIGVDSEEDIGSHFFFTLKMEQGSAEQTSDPLSLEEEISLHIPAMTILIVEDNEMNQKVLQGFLQKGDHDLYFCNSAEQALDILQEKNFDVIFTDINLSGGGMDGITLTKTIKQSGIATPVVAITGNVSSEDIEEYYQSGFKGFIAKPIDPDEIKQTLYQIGSGDDETSKPAEKRENTMSDSDLEILRSLYETLGHDQWLSLLNEYQEMADKIIESLEAMNVNSDIKDIEGKAHELKGMAANFGMNQVSHVAGDIENACQAEHFDLALQNITLLSNANQAAKDNLAAWIESLKNQR